MSEAASAADRRLHTEVCLAARPGQSWLDLCQCGELRARHADATHRPIPTGPGATCSGRNLAGACRTPTCSCTRFTLKEPYRG
ncbi:MAG TPA: hypothetical protein VJT31_02430 [Rugosimonospora sp.]|nr:hypothetical protein [Rugosimonospora sp.]